MQPVRVMVVDDHQVVREGIKALLAGQPDLEVVGEADNGRDALDLVGRVEPEVVVIDVSMPEMSGVETTTALMRHMPQLRVLALSVHEEIGYVRRLLEAGAVGYILKRSVNILIPAIRSIADGGTYIDPLVADRLVAQVVSRSDGAPKLLQPLSERELHVLQLIARGHSNKEIGVMLNISTKTVETYKARGMEKLGLGGRAEIIRHALEHGWFV